MGKKVVIEAPITREEYATLLDIWSRLRPVLDALAPAVTSKVTSRFNYETHEYREADGYHSVTDEGVSFYYVDTVAYEDDRSAFTELIPLQAILDPMPYLNRFEADKAAVAKSRAASIHEQERVAYERLKAKFEKN